MYLKWGSPPVINPDSSKMPEKFLKEGRPSMYKLSFKSDTKPRYVNITSPIPGSYFAAVYHPYTNPQSEGITQEGLSPMCNTFLDVSVYGGVFLDEPQIILEGDKIDASLINDGVKLYKFYVPQFVDRILLSTSNISWHECDGIRMVIHPNNVSSLTFNSNSRFGVKNLLVEEDTWYLIALNLIRSICK